MELDLTNVCSHQCPLCVGRRNPDGPAEALYTVAGDGEHLPTARASEFIRQMAEAGVRGLIFTGGGEPTVHSDLVGLVQQAAARGLDVGLITHGGLLHRHDVASLVASCTWIRVSVDAASPERFQAVHGAGRLEWDRVWANVDRLVAARDARRTAASPEPAATLGLGFLAGPENVGEIAAFAALARAHGVDYAQVRPFHRYITFDVRPHLAAAKARFDSPSFTLVASMQKYSRVIEGAVEPRNYSYCHIAHFASVICANEKMYVCCHYRNLAEFCIGDLRQESLVEVLNGPRRARVMAALQVSGCQSLCRGDHVNREIQRWVEARGAPSAPDGPSPAHVNFL
jgi:pyruvate-formate lyase-activating enzyme